jgi:crossover junction endodeoxyribonuclease RuvC
LILGIDPGTTGALAWLSDTGVLIEVVDMPTIEIKVGKSKRQRVNPALVAHLFAKRRPDTVVLEEVASQPNDGAIAAFTFGRSFGVLEGVIAALHIPVVMVRPPVWKKDMRLTADKGYARMRATQYWPGAADMFLRVKDDGRAEAALLARWHIERERQTVPRVA